MDSNRHGPGLRSSRQFEPVTPAFGGRRYLHCIPHNAYNTDDRELRARLVGMLLGGGMLSIGKDEGKVLSLLERNGVFLAGAALVGPIAFRARQIARANGQQR